MTAALTAISHGHSNSLAREFETFQPIPEGEARVYKCGPTVYNYLRIGNMRTYVFVGAPDCASA
jgi:cysteinyl-tRNA synthetase